MTCGADAAPAGSESHVAKPARRRKGSLSGSKDSPATSQPAATLASGAPGHQRLAQPLMLQNDLGSEQPYNEQQVESPQNGAKIAAGVPLGFPLAAKLRCPAGCVCPFLPVLALLIGSGIPRAQTLETRANRPHQLKRPLARLPTPPRRVGRTRQVIKRTGAMALCTARGAPLQMAGCPRATTTMSARRLIAATNRRRPRTRMGR